MGPALAVGAILAVAMFAAVRSARARSGVSGSGPSTPWPTSKPEPGLGLPRVEDPGSGEEDLFLPKRRYETLHI